MKHHTFSTHALKLLLAVVVCLFVSCKKPASESQSTVLAPENAKGSLELVNCDGIAGWACDMTRPNAHVNVDIYDDTNLLASVPADQFRKDLKDSFGNGEHGFYFKVPDSLKDGKPHPISVKIPKAVGELAMSPKILTCPQGAAGR